MAAKDVKFSRDARERIMRGVGIWTGLAAGLGVVAVLMLWRWSRRDRLALLPAGW